MSEDKITLKIDSVDKLTEHWIAEGERIATERIIKLLEENKWRDEVAFFSSSLLSRGKRMMQVPISPGWCSFCGRPWHSWERCIELIKGEPEFTTTRQKQLYDLATRVENRIKGENK